MKRTISTIILALFCVTVYAQDMAPILKYVQNKSSIREGGTEVFQYGGSTYVISVAYLAVTNKTESQCKTVGSSKAKKEMLSYINGSDITSYTELKITENAIEGVEGRKVESQQEYNEVIKETVVGSIDQVTPLGGWFSEDHTIYYFAIYKSI